MNPETPAPTPIPATAPYDFARTLAYFQRRAGELVDSVCDGAYHRVLLQDGKPVLVEVRGAGTVDAPRLTLQLLSESPDSLDFASTSIRRSLGLDHDLLAFRAAMSSDPPLAEVVDACRGLRLVQTQTAFEALVWAIIGQQINLTFAFRLKSAIVRAYGTAVVYREQLHWAFPTPERLASADEAALAAGGLGARKSRAIMHVARLVAGDDLDLEGLTQLTREEAMRTLTALPGIGPWTAAYTLLRGLGDPGACPVTDLGLRAAAGRVYELGGAATPKQMEALAERWGEWCGYAAFYLWNSSLQPPGHG